MGLWRPNALITLALFVLGLSLLIAGIVKQNRDDRLNSDCSNGLNPDCPESSSNWPDCCPGGGDSGTTMASIGGVIVFLSLLLVGYWVCWPSKEGAPGNAQRLQDIENRSRQERNIARMQGY